MVTMGMKGTRTTGTRTTGTRTTGTRTTGTRIPAGDLARVPELVDGLRRAGIQDVDAGPLARVLYSSDASLYRVPPMAVAYPRDTDEVVAAHEVCRSLGIPITSRGAGTSIAGNAVGTGLVLDYSRSLNRIVDLDPDDRSAVVEPGVVQAQLQRAAAPHGLRFGPDPSSHNRCTIGGMIGNNACGSRALGYGRTSDNVLGLDVLTGTGERLTLPGSAAAEQAHAPSAALDALRGAVSAALGPIRLELGRFRRQVSGYGLEHLLPEHGFDVARALVGSEGTLATVLRARLRLVAEPLASCLVVLGYPDMAEAADAVPQVLAYNPTACEGLDSRILKALRAAHPGSRVPPLPRGSGWLLVELAGQTQTQVRAAAVELAARADSLDAAVITDPGQAAVLWRIREDGAGLASRTADGRPAFPGWEDAAVPPERLGAYLRDFEQLLTEHQLTGLPYGHFGDGCVHIRLDFPLHRTDGASRLQSFLVDAAHLVASHGGSISGEHGDGRARSALLPLMYSPELIDLFARVKGIFDPDGLLNPGVLVNPRPVTADLRSVGLHPRTSGLGLSYRQDAGDFAAAVHRCNGVGKCRADATGSGDVMCPSYQATRDEKDSTRGRARVLQDLVDGSPRPDWRSPVVREALELCLSCKGCATDCPTGTDVAAYKAEVLYQSYRHRPRPRSHYTLGWLPRWARLASTAPRAVNAALSVPAVATSARWLAGIDQRRDLPAFAARTFRQWFHREHVGPATGDPVLLWVDSFTEHFSPEVGAAAVRVLEDAGYRVQIPDRSLCCGLTWITTGQLDAARRRVGRSVAHLRRHAENGVPIVGLEPSCTAVLRSDSLDLLDHPAAQSVATATVTLAELLARTPGWEPPDLSGRHLIAQPHCHHAAVLGWDADQDLLTRSGASVQRLGGCCGLAGNFGVERGHHEVSLAVAEQSLLPAVRSAPPGTVVLADGFSCRTQLALVPAPALHLAQLLAAALD